MERDLGVILVCSTYSLGFLWEGILRTFVVEPGAQTCDSSTQNADAGGRMATTGSKSAWVTVKPCLINRRGGGEAGRRRRGNSLWVLSWMVIQASGDS